MFHCVRDRADDAGVMCFPAVSEIEQMMQG